MAAANFPASWCASAQATNAAATASESAPTAPSGVTVSPRVLVVTGVDASFSAAPAAPVLLEIKDGSTVIWQAYVPVAGGLARTFVHGLRITAGNAASAVLAAGGSTVVGSVNLDGVAV